VQGSDLVVDALDAPVALRRRFQDELLETAADDTLEWRHVLLAVGARLAAGVLRRSARAAITGWWAALLERKSRAARSSGSSRQ
jgi:hypothetical protein